MKKKKYEKQIPQDLCQALRPPWELNKTKKDCYFAGINEGYEKATSDFKKKEVGLQERANLARVEMLRSIATITDAASHALLSYDNKL